MTRWAKAGHSQKHQKMPEDPTPWEELSKSLKKSATSKQLEQNTTSDNEKISGANRTSERENYINSKRLSDKTSSYKKEAHKNRALKIESLVSKDSNESESEENAVAVSNKSCKATEKCLSKRQMKRLKWEKKRKTEMSTASPDRISIKNSDDLDCTHQDALIKNSVERNEDSDELLNERTDEVLTEKPLSKRQLKKLKKETNEKNMVANTELSSQPRESRSNHLESETSAKSSPNKNRLKKKEMFMQRLQKKRELNGIILLSPKTERRLYLIKKKLRAKSFPPEVIKDIIRKERRKAEILFRKNIVTKTCFNCRQSGHVLTDCPFPSNGAYQETGICFKCGSTEHTSVRCRKQVSGYPFATCFICKAQGHISRECPSNKNGLYPKGGKCNLCDSINHLRKDCPSLKKKEEEPSFTLHTINEGMSIDDEIINTEKEMKKKILKKPKIVKF